MLYALGQSLDQGCVFGCFGESRSGGARVLATLRPPFHRCEDGGHVEVWERTDPIEAIDIEISEIWENIDPRGDPSVEHTTIKTHSLQQWLNATIRPDPKNSSPVPFQQCSIRIVWVTVAREEHAHHMSESQMDAVVDAFKLDLAYKYYRTSGAGATEISQRHGSRIQSQYTFSYWPKTAAIWTRNLESNTLQAIFFTVEDHIKIFQQLLDRRRRMSDQDMFIPFLCSTMIGVQVDEASNKINAEIRGIENRTGFHDWKIGDTKLAPNDLEALLHRSSAMSTKAASSLWKIRILTNLHHFISERLDSSVSMEAPNDDDHQLSADSKDRGVLEDESATTNTTPTTIPPPPPPTRPLLPGATLSSAV